MRDSQRGKVYAAERTLAEMDAEPLRHMIQVWSFIERIERDRWFRRHYGYRKFRVTDGRSSRNAWAYGSTRITLPRWSRKPLVMLHEIAHCLTAGKTGHGWEFAATYLQLVRHFMGAATHAKLRAAFKQHRVRYHAPRRMSEAARAAATERLAAYRLGAKVAACEPPARRPHAALLVVPEGRHWFVSLDGQTWIEVQRDPRVLAYESVERLFNGASGGTLPMRMTRRFLRLRGAVFLDEPARV